MKKLNPAYEFILFDDIDMDTFIQSNFSKDVYDCYMQLNVGAAKADFWRYCILYKNGGIYLDIDSEIIRPLDELIAGDEQCIITREGNPGYFNNWMMIFEKEHPILLECIKKCCYNIKNKTTNDICKLTGPHGAFTDAVNDVMVPLYIKFTNLYFETDTDLNGVLNVTTNRIRCRFYGVDMESFARFKHSHVDELYQNNVYWRDETNIFKEIEHIVNMENMENIFTNIYEHRVWGDNDSGEYNGASGGGSLLDYNKDSYVPFLKKFIIDNNKKNIVDLGCGDFLCGKLIYDDLDVSYTGYDTYKKVIDYHLKHHSSPKYSFVHLDFYNYKESIVGGDLCILKDVIQHWKIDEIYAFLDFLVEKKLFKHILICNCSYQTHDNPENNDRFTPLSFMFFPLKKYNPVKLYSYGTKEVSVISVN
jgi:hypothetical protein